MEGQPPWDRIHRGHTWSQARQRRPLVQNRPAGGVCDDPRPSSWGSCRGRGQCIPDGCPGAQGWVWEAPMYSGGHGRWGRGANPPGAVLYPWGFTLPLGRWGSRPPGWCWAGTQMLTGVRQWLELGRADSSWLDCPGADPCGSMGGAPSWWGWKRGSRRAGDPQHGLPTLRPAPKCWGWMDVLA